MEKICEISMVSANGVEPCGAIWLNRNTLKPTLMKHFNALSNWSGQHLCVTDSEKIKEGDWVVDAHLDRIIQIKTAHKKLGEFVMDSGAEGYRRIIATTDKSLTLCGVSDHEEICDCVKLAKIDEGFIKFFAESQGAIKEVLVEYDTFFQHPKGCAYTADNKPTIIYKQWYEPKLREDGTIIIRPLNEQIAPIATPQRYMGKSMRRIIFQYDDVAEYGKAYESLKAQGLDVSVFFGLILALSVKTVELEHIELVMAQKPHPQTKAHEHNRG